jgi:CHAD domain-containing protein
MIDLAEWISHGPWLVSSDRGGARDQPVRAFAVAALDRLDRKVRKGGRDLAGVGNEARHAVRKHAKSLRYAAEFFTSLFDRKHQRRRHAQFLAALGALQDRLGALNDRATGPDILAKLVVGDARQAMKLLFPEPERALLAAAGHAHDKLVEARRFWR